MILSCRAFSYLLCQTLALSLVLPCTWCQARQLRQPGAKGHQVVDDVIKVLADSCLYRDDGEFLRRLAYVQSHDGHDFSTFRQGYDGGIWQVDKDKFELTQREAAKLKPEYTNLGSKLGIDWSRITWSDLLKPLYSGIAAALYTKLKSQAAPVPNDVTGQAKFWQTNVMPGKTVQDFTGAVSSREENCETADLLDILFAVDTSVIMTDAQWTQVKNYIKAKVIQMEQEKGLGMQGHRVAMVTYSSAPLLAFLFEGTTDLQSVLAEIDLAPKLGGSSNLTSALVMAKTMVFPRSRPQADKVMVIITDRPSNNGNRAAVESIGLKSQGVVIRMIGIGSTVQLAELDSISSAPHCSFSSRFQSYSELGFDNHRYSQRICRESVQLVPGVYTYPCSHNFLGRVPGDGTAYSVTTSVSDGEVDFLASHYNPVPTLAKNELSQRLKSSQPIIHIANDTRTLSIKVNTDRPSQGHNGTRSCNGNFTITVDVSGPKAQKCNGKHLDLLLLFDTTVASNPTVFQRLVNFSMQYASHFDIGLDKNHVGVASFDQSARNLIWLKDSMNLPQFLSAMRQLTPPGSPSSSSASSSRTSAAMKWAREIGFSFQHGGRPDSSKSVILFTTGHPSTLDAAAAKTEGQLAQSEGIRVVVVAVDTTFDDASLATITSSPLRVLKVTDMTQIGQNLQALTNATCGSVSVKCVEQGVTRDCSPDDLINSQYGQIVVGDRNLTANPCNLPPIPGMPEITRFPHPTRKDRFIICDRKHQAYVALCPVGEVYNPKDKECDNTPTTVTPPPVTTARQPLVVVISSTKTPTSTASTTPTTTTPTTTVPPPSDSQIIAGKCTYNNIRAGYRLHEYPGNRNLYINCSLNMGQGRIIACPQGQWWVQSSSACAYVCPIVDRSKNQVDCSITNPCDGPLLYYPNPKDRSTYLQCNPRKEALVKSCPPYQVFKPKLASCDLP